VTFADLGLVVVDEQHRFGVEQRDVLRGKGRTSPHLLVMTATPIPRTVAMTVFGDLETSTLVEVPAGRSPVSTHVVPLAESPAWYERIWRRLAEEVAGGHQAYVVCPRIGEDDEVGQDGEDDESRQGEIGQDDEAGDASEDGDAVLIDDAMIGGELDQQDEDAPALRGVLATVAELRITPALAGLRIEVLHGRMPADQRESVMAATTAGEVDVLVATTVIEVGVDVPNATAMVVLDADRFGVSQLHQLRGRVGRGSAGGVCLLVTQAPPGNPSRTRLDAVAATTDGFALARVDLEQRREGDVLGARQSGGRSSLRILRVLRDEKVIEQARQEATTLVATDPDLITHPALVAELTQLLDDEQQAYLERG
jgi:ATP-dependent DNA helicase RecG